MPLDGKVTDFTAPAKVEPLSDDPAIAVRQAIALLRGPLPENFEWYYGNVRNSTHCGTRGCGLGWFQIAWPDKFPRTMCVFEGCQKAEAAFGLNDEAATAVFAGAAGARGLEWEDVTPAMVADDLEAWADQKYGRPQP